ncbi:uncharacterized protein A1O5_07112 [Cladophialophora psammophila CBS 110553]|uniref:AAA+ ATPase domain-containing protein n=1 Tax=Cladophialophora psammophila CBS 110553 TaxID=1182543 RepID=W9XI50_9EURO|nr:uncharacterized protein A1O5_07112 [Cladophialophora psammophila CBS 110553]EXJ70039.1 hypothetical protein A1O5_07112 [Cladophialophora psammophila CBS 110553]
MTQDAISNVQPQTSLEERFATLEAKFVSLEKRYCELQQETVFFQQSSSGKPGQNGADTTSSKLVSVNGVGNKDPPSKDAGSHTNTRPSPEETGVGPKSRARIVINRTDSESHERRDFPAEDQPADPSDNPDTSYAFTLRKIVGDSEDDDGEIDIVDQNLWELLKGLLSHYPYHTFRGSPSTISAPYEALVLNWDKLEQATKIESGSDSDKQARSDLKLLLDTITNSSGDAKLDKYFKTRDSHKQQNSVTFDNLWTIFAPGTLVYGRPFQGQDQVFVVQDNIGPWPYFSDGVPREQATWTLLAWTYDWNGSIFKRRPLRLEFEYFDGTKPITSLPYYPFQFHEQQGSVRENLIQQGIKYRKFCTATQGSRLFDYRGDALLVKKGFSGVQADDDMDDDARRFFDSELEYMRRRRHSRFSQKGAPHPKSANVDSRVMVDFESYFVFGPSVARVGALWPDDDNPQCNCNDCQENDLLNESFRTKYDEEACQKGKWEDEQYMLCPPRVLGYVLGDKQWAQLQVSLLAKIPDKDPEDAWSTRLKLADDGKTKKMILDLVEGHGKSDLSEDNRLEVDDIIARKGKGLVILLYGPPGVGKTSTAETVALAARKPLFAISVADVGTKAKNVEANLKKIFDLATSWQAILLIDEADVFLESRGQGVAANTERNALVSVFLRVLEYYQGILMLTTNQIAKFDVAVQSRIHVAFKYVSLNEDQTMGIFGGFLGPLAKKGLVKDWDDIKEWLLEDVVKMGFDGRQIRNIVTSALGLARAQGKSRLEKSHIKLVLNNVKDFKDEFIKQFEKYKTEQAGGRDALM